MNKNSSIGYVIYDNKKIKKVYKKVANATLLILIFHNYKNKK